MWKLSNGEDVCTSFKLLYLVPRNPMALFRTHPLNRPHSEISLYKATQSQALWALTFDIVCIAKDYCTYSCWEIVSTEKGNALESLH